MTNTPTAIEFLKEAQSNPTKGWSTHKAMIEFAKMHVKLALESADNKAEVTPIDHEEISEGSFRPVWGVDSNSILNSYSLDNIK